jgi:outer membrane lipoprotein-sorting protein
VGREPAVEDVLGDAVRPEDERRVATKKSLGTAKVSGFVCDKFQLTYKNKQMGTSTVWFAKRLDWPIKTETKTVHGTVVTECKSVKMGGQSASLFEIPKGYKKVAMPGPPGMAGGPKPHMKPAPKKPK